MPKRLGTTTLDCPFHSASEPLLLLFPLPGKSTSTLTYLHIFIFLGSVPAEDWLKVTAPNSHYHNSVCHFLHDSSFYSSRLFYLWPFPPRGVNSSTVYCLSNSFLSPWCLRQSMAHNRCSVNVGKVNEGVHLTCSRKGRATRQLEQSEQREEVDGADSDGH